MKKIFQIGVVLCGILMTQFAYAQNEGCCAPAVQQQEAAPCDQPTGECICKYVHYEPCYYNNWKCCDDVKMCKEKCTRYVPQYYQVQRCKMVPQYYTETCCRQVAECYYVDKCIPCKKWVCEKCCKYVPRYYYKKTCGNPCAAGAVGGCGAGSFDSNVNVQGFNAGSSTY